MAKQQCETSVGLRSAEIQLLLSTRFVQLRPNVFIADGPNYVCLPCHRVSGEFGAPICQRFQEVQNNQVKTSGREGNPPDGKLSH